MSHKEEINLAHTIKCDREPTFVKRAVFDTNFVKVHRNTELA